MMAGDDTTVETPEIGETSWLRLSDGLIGGIHHTINNRMAALGAAGQVLEADLPPGHPLSGLLTGEVQRLETTVTLLRLLTEGDSEHQPIEISETLKDVQQLFAIHHSMRDIRLEITCEPGLVPLWAQTSLLLRTVMLCLVAATDRSHGRRGSVNLVVSGDSSFVCIEVTRLIQGDGDEGETVLGGIGAAGIGDLAKKLGGTFDFEDVNGRVRVLLTLPTLLEVRRREHE